ncbi:Smr/MutS family protein [Labrys sp. KB_33_2]|uniref:Smr/MutS family protein n=1 Tax=Labrys sp. KB_33_2 TaxID=3237479 RepID=UPI003F93EB07
MTRRKGLTAEDSELWAFVTREIIPLKRRRRKLATAVAKAAETPPEPASPPARPAAKPKAAASRPVKPPPAPPIPPIAPIDKNERRQVVRGTRAIDARIDLHGMRQVEAHGALRGFLAIAQMRGYSMVLVITGKGGGGDMAFSGDERGVLRRVVPQWLRMPDLRPLILGFEEAHHGHGGSGALYVRLRRIRRLGER